MFFTSGEYFGAFFLDDDDVPRAPPRPPLEALEDVVGVADWLVLDVFLLPPQDFAFWASNALIIPKNKNYGIVL